MSAIRIGAVEYLNARPLVYGLERNPRFDVRFDLPARCAELLHEGKTDLGLIPSIELMRAPSGVDAYRVVPDLAVTSRGAVASVALFTTREPRDIRTIALDTSSRTSVALTRVVCNRIFDIAPRLEPHPPDLPAMLAHADAALVIGDIALFLAGGPLVVRDSNGGRTVMVQKIDLGELWFQTTGLPFVYAFWAGRPGLLTADDVRSLQRTRDEALTQVPAVAELYFPGESDRRRTAERYLRDNIRYRLGHEEREGLERFYRYAAEAGVIPRAATPLFYENPD